MLSHVKFILPCVVFPCVFIIEYVFWQVWIQSPSCVSFSRRGSVKRDSSASSLMIWTFRGRVRRSISTATSVMKVKAQELYIYIYIYIYIYMYHFVLLNHSVILCLYYLRWRHGGVGSRDPWEGCGIEEKWIQPEQANWYCKPVFFLSLCISNLSWRVLVHVDWGLFLVLWYKFSCTIYI